MDGLPFRWIVFLIVLCLSHALSVLICDAKFPGVGADGQPSSLAIGQAIPTPGSH